MHAVLDSRMFMHVSDYSKTQKMCHKAVEKDSFYTTLKLKKCLKKTVQKWLLAIIDILDQHKTQQI